MAQKAKPLWGATSWPGSSMGIAVLTLLRSAEIVLARSGVGPLHQKIRPCAGTDSEK